MSGFLSKSKQKLEHTSKLSFTGEFKLLGNVISTEKGVLASHIRAGTEIKKAANALEEWSAAEGADLSDTIGKVAKLLGNDLAKAEEEFSEHLQTYRVYFKDLRTREEKFSALKKSKDNLQSKIDATDKKLSKLNPEHKDIPNLTNKLMELRNEMAGLEHSVIIEDAAITDYRRQRARAAMAYKLGAVCQLGEKLSIIGELGKLLIGEIPIGNTEPGHERPLYNSYDRTQQIYGEAQTCLHQVVFNAGSTEPQGATSETIGAANYLPPPRQEDYDRSYDADGVEYSSHAQQYGDVQATYPDSAALHVHDTNPASPYVSAGTQNAQVAGPRDIGSQSFEGQPSRLSHDSAGRTSQHYHLPTPAHDKVGFSDEVKAGWQEQQPSGHEHVDPANVQVAYTGQAPDRTSYRAMELAQVSHAHGIGGGDIQPGTTDLQQPYGRVEGIGAPEDYAEGQYGSNFTSGGDYGTVSPQDAPYPTSEPTPAQELQPTIQTAHAESFEPSGLPPPATAAVNSRDFAAVAPEVAQVAARSGDEHSHGISEQPDPSAAVQISTPASNQQYSSGRQGDDHVTSATQSSTSPLLGAHPRDHNELQPAMYPVTDSNGSMPDQEPPEHRRTSKIEGSLPSAGAGSDHDTGTAPSSLPAPLATSALPKARRSPAAARTTDTVDPVSSSVRSPLPISGADNTAKTSSALPTSNVGNRQKSSSTSPVTPTGAGFKGNPLSASTSQLPSPAPPKSPVRKTSNPPPQPSKRQSMSSRDPDYGRSSIAYLNEPPPKIAPPMRAPPPVTSVLPLPSNSPYFNPYTALQSPGHNQAVSGMDSAGRGKLGSGSKGDLSKQDTPLGSRFGYDMKAVQNPIEDRQLRQQPIPNANPSAVTHKDYSYAIKADTDGTGRKLNAGAFRRAPASSASLNSGYSSQHADGAISPAARLRDEWRASAYATPMGTPSVEVSQPTDGNHAASAFDYTGHPQIGEGSGVPAPYSHRTSAIDAPTDVVADDPNQSYGTSSEADEVLPLNVRKRSLIAPEDETTNGESGQHQSANSTGGFGSGNYITKLE